MNAPDVRRSKRRNPARRLLSAVMLFFFCAFLLLSVANGELDTRALLLSAVVPALIYMGVMAMRRAIPRDRLLLSLTNFLCALGVLVQYRLSAENGLNQALNYGLGMVAMLACILLSHVRGRARSGLTVIIAVGALGLLALPLLFGRESGGAKNWVYLGGVSLQPSEVVKLALLYVLANTFSKRRYVWGLAFSAASLVMLMLQKDLGTALLYYGVTLCLMYASTRSVPLVGAGLAGGVGAAVLGYRMFAHVRRRVAVWLHPTLDPSGAGYQITQALIAMANGGVWGVGLGLGNPESVPVIESDFIFTAIVLEFGLVFALCVICMYVCIIWRGAGIALGARESFPALLSLGCVCFIGLQTFVIIGGNVGLIPLTGVTLPFISSGGTSMLSSLGLIGFLQGVYNRNARDIEEDKRLAGEAERE